MTETLYDKRDNRSKNNERNNPQPRPLGYCNDCRDYEIFDTDQYGEQRYCDNQGNEIADTMGSLSLSDSLDGNR